MDTLNRTKASQKVTIVGGVVDFLLAIFKVIAGVIGNSGALIADGIHSFSDFFTLPSIPVMHQMQNTPMVTKGLRLLQL